jgi:hypothetical protein
MSCDLLKIKMIRAKMSFEKAFINQSLRIILSPRYWEFSPMKLGKSFHIGTEVDIWNTKTQSENHCIHLNYTTHKIPGTSTVYWVA